MTLHSVRIQQPYLACLYGFSSAGVVREGLTHPSIPDGWRWNGVVSDHCPVWAEFYCDRDFDETTGPTSVDNIAIDGKERTS